jgi:hypothetical protein
MRSLILISTILASTTVFAQADQLICGFVIGKAYKEKVTSIVREDMGNGSYTEDTNVTLKVKNLTMEVNQVFERISIEVKDSKGNVKIRMEGENTVGVDINPDSANTLNASCTIQRNK